MDKKREQLSRYLSYLLRHNPAQLGLTLDADGFVSLERLIAGIRQEKRWAWITLQDIAEIQEKSGKNRFEIVGDRIRALYGHTLPSKVHHDEVAPPEILYHGTPRKNLQSILKKGISPMHRQYVHLSSTPEEAVNVGERRDERPVIIRVRALDAYNSGVKFYRAGLVFLSNPIPPKYLESESEA